MEYRYRTQEEQMREHAERERQKKDVQAMAYLLEDERGRWFLMRLFEKCHVFASYMPRSDKTEDILLFEGERRAALHLDILTRQNESLLEHRQQAEKEYFTFQSSLDRLIETAIETDGKGDSA